jgi:hypothetical protein
MINSRYGLMHRGVSLFEGVHSLLRVIIILWVLVWILGVHKTNL